eukprot:Gregarina_sp_Poly_1__9156@NODE_562_length_7523_cov_90_276019_g442_i0_p2_GENE_NODE_562_length_7523_cov_90_276019_g442_i0NODE_562_length_7523_cov_90_276019_g442_i0_p2_ORF_typecomplete_len450_score71_57Coatomer_WDAD/PF04053_14/2_4e93TPR_2/PF07719_17/0_031_NODE_562_length_7523_cov_90_276019_g442_i048316180
MEVLEIFGGNLIGVRGEDFVCFYEWQTTRFIRRVDCAATGIYWSDNGDLLAMTTADEYFILKYDSTAVAAAIAAGAPEQEEGIEIAFDLLHEATECVESGLWVGDCFIFVTKSLRLQTFVAGQVETLAFLTRKQFLLGYVPETSRIYLADREVNVTSYKLHLPFLQFQSLLVRGMLSGAKEALDKVPAELHERVARFLVHKGYKELALKYTTDEDYKFDIALSSGNLAFASSVIIDMENSKKSPKTLNLKWKQLGDSAMQLGDFQVASDAFRRCKDIKGILLMASTMGDSDLMKEVRDMAQESKQQNVAFLANLLLHDHDACLQTLITGNKLAEANIYSRTFKPSMLQEVYPPWVESLLSLNAHYATRLIAPFNSDGSPSEDPAFGDLQAQLELARLFMKADDEAPKPAREYGMWKELLEYDFLQEYKELGEEQIWEALVGCASENEEN